MESHAEAFVAPADSGRETFETITVVEHDVFLERGYYRTPFEDTARAARVNVEHVPRSDRPRRHLNGCAFFQLLDGTGRSADDTVNPLLTRLCARLLN